MKSYPGLGLEDELPGVFLVYYVMGLWGTEGEVVVWDVVVLGYEGLDLGLVEGLSWLLHFLGLCF